MTFLMNRQNKTKLEETLAELPEGWLKRATLWGGTPNNKIDLTPPITVTTTKGETLIFATYMDFHKFIRDLFADFVKPDYEKLWVEEQKLIS